MCFPAKDTFFSICQNRESEKNLNQKLASKIYFLDCCNLTLLLKPGKRFIDICKKKMEKKCETQKCESFFSFDENKEGRGNGSGCEKSASNKKASF